MNQSEKETELQVLYKISQAVSARRHNVSELLNDTLQIMEREMGILRGALTLRKPGPDILHIEASFGLSDTEMRRGQYKLGEGITGRAAQTGCLEQVCDISLSFDFLNRTKARGVEKQAIHFNSPRTNKPFISVNCTALPENLIESELFGHEKGAFTGAQQQRKGRFELANGGTIFLDEIGDISPSVHIRLLRVLQEKSFERVGSKNTIRVNVRVVGATSRNLEKDISKNTFHDVLYYRLNVRLRSVSLTTASRIWTLIPESTNNRT